MSDEPRNPGLWLAGDRTDTQVESVVPAPVPEVPTSDSTTPIDVPDGVPTAPKRPVWSGESDRRPTAGPMFPDLFKQALADTGATDEVTVKLSDGDGDRTHVDDAGRELVVTPGHRPTEVGEFIGASARRRRWRH